MMERMNLNFEEMNSTDKPLILSFSFFLILSSFSTLAYSQYRDIKVTQDNLENLEIIQIDQADNATLIHCKLTREAYGSSCLPYEFVIFDPITYSTYEVYEGLNIPMCGTAAHIFKDTVLHLTIATEKIASNSETLQLKSENELVKEFKINWDVAGPILNMEGFHGMTPIRILETKYVDGKAIKVFTTPEYIVAAQIEFVQEYGKYNRVNLTIVNNTSRPFLLNPSAFTAQYSSDDGSNWYDAELWSHEEYIKRVANRQAWSAALVAMSEAMDAEEAGKTTTTTNSTYTGSSATSASVYGGGYNTYSGYNSYSAVGNSSTSSSLRGTTTTTTEDGTAKYLAQKEADAKVAAYAENLNSQKQVLSQGYLKLNTIEPNVQIDGFIQFNYDKRATNMAITIPIGNDSFMFVW